MSTIYKDLKAPFTSARIDQEGVNFHLALWAESVFLGSLRLTADQCTQLLDMIRLNQAPKKELRIWDIKTIIEAKEGAAADLKNRHCSELPLGNQWDDDGKREQYNQLKREVKELRISLAGMA